MARLDHVALRTTDRYKAADFYIKALGYRVQQEFKLDFGDDKWANCIALEPPEKRSPQSPWTLDMRLLPTTINSEFLNSEYHLPPEIFISDGNKGSIVGDWVALHGPGIHHCAYQCDDVRATMLEWAAKGYCEFSSDVIQCPGLDQVFSKPSELTGIIYELIKRDEFGFCKENVKQLMESSQPK